MAQDRNQSGLRGALFVAMLLWSCTACGGTTTRTLIITRPHAAEVTTKGRVLGKSPIELTEQAWVWSSRELVIRKKGYLPAKVTLDSSARWVNIGVLGAGCIFGFWAAWPLALLGDRPTEIVVRLRKPKGLRDKAERFAEQPDVTLRPKP